MKKPSEVNSHIQDILIQQIARNAVLETLLTQTIVRLSGLFDHPQEFIRMVMIHTEDSLGKGVKDAANAPDEVRQLAEESLGYFHDYSGRLVAAMTPKTTKN